jgi:hypothetical protein
LVAAPPCAAARSPQTRPRKDRGAEVNPSVQATTHTHARAHRHKKHNPLALSLSLANALAPCPFPRALDERRETRDRSVCG